MVWAFLFLLPLRVALAKKDMLVEVLPDAVGWLIFLIALRGLTNLHASVRVLRRLALLGLVVGIPRVVGFRQSEMPWEHLYRLLQAAGAIVALVFVARLCGLVGEMAEHADRTSVRDSARLRLWLYLVGVLLPFCGLFLADPSGITFVAVQGAMFLYIAITISLMMGLMAITARMCAQMEHAPPAGVQDAGPPGEKRQGT